MNELITVLSQYGFPGAVLVGLGYIARWLATNVAKPLTERHIKFLDETASTFQRLDDRTENIEQKLDDIHTRLTSRA